MQNLLLTESHLIEPGGYWTTCYDGPEGIVGLSFETYALTFDCHLCLKRLRSPAIVPNSVRVDLTDIDLKSIDRDDFVKICDRLAQEKMLGTAYHMHHQCPHCSANYLVIFGAAEWQPARYVIMLGAIYEYA
ncbi:MAG: hypothetical protein AAGD96_21795 [Chloroflexota bacterium]